MPGAHTHGMTRICGATTVVIGQSHVYVNGKLWAVEGDPNTHGNGALIASGSTVFINGKKVIVHAPDTASADNRCPPEGPPHCEPATAQGSGNVKCY